MKRLLVPINFSDVSKKALPFALHIASQTGASITLMTSGASPLTEDNLSRELGYDLPADPEPRNNVLKKALRDLVADFSSQTDFQFVVRQGVVMRDIVTEAKAGNYDLLVMGTHGVQVPAEEIWGTYAANLIRELDIPMLIIPPGNKPEQFSHLVYAAALEGGEETSLEVLRPFAELFSADLSLLHITTRADAEISERMLDLEANYIFTPIREAPLELMHHNRVSDGLKSYLERHEPTILAIKPQHRNFIESLFHASLSRKLALHIKSPILILRDH